MLLLLLIQVKFKTLASLKRTDLKRFKLNALKKRLKLKQSKLQKERVMMTTINTVQVLN